MNGGVCLKCITFVLSVTACCILLSGCGNQGNPDYSLFNNVPHDRLAKVKAAVKNSGIHNFELPTKFPYPVTSANIPENGEFPNQVTIYFGNPSHAIELDVHQAPENVVSMSSIRFANEVETKLPNGVKALYGYNGAASQLAWDENGVLYILNSMTDKNKPDLNEKQLIDVANSFN